MGGPPGGGHVPAARRFPAELKRDMLLHIPEDHSDDIMRLVGFVDVAQDADIE